MNEKLKARRVALGLKQAELAEAIGVSQAAISAFERGVRQPSAEVLDRLVVALDACGPEILGYTVHSVSSVKLASFKPVTGDAPCDA